MDASIFAAHLIWIRNTMQYRISTYETSYSSHQILVIESTGSIFSCKVACYNSSSSSDKCGAWIPSVHWSGDDGSCSWVSCPAVVVSIASVISIVIRRLWLELNEWFYHLITLFIGVLTSPFKVVLGPIIAGLWKFLWARPELQGRGIQDICSLAVLFRTSCGTYIGTQTIQKCYILYTYTFSFLWVNHVRTPWLHHGVSNPKPEQRQSPEAKTKACHTVSLWIAIPNMLGEDITWYNPARRI